MLNKVKTRQFYFCRRKIAGCLLAFNDFQFVNLQMALKLHLSGYNDL